MTWDADVLVVGCGIAGGVTALQLADAGLRVAVLSRVVPPRGMSTYYAQGGIVYRGIDDSPQQLAADILHAGGHRSNPRAVEILAEEGPRWVEEILVRRLGVPFDREGRGYALAREGGHSVARILHVADRTGKAIAEALLAALRSHPRVAMRSGITALDLIVVPLPGAASPRCVGLWGWDQRARCVRRWLAPYTAIATGGLAAVYERTTNPPGSRGDGIAMAYRAGARLADLEYVQFHPTAFAKPGAPSFLISEAVRGAGARLVRADGTPFMDAYEPLWQDLAPRDVVARAVYQEMRRRGTTHVYLDLRSYIPREEIVRRFPHLYRLCLKYGVDMTQDLVPVAPAAHYTCGGIWTDLWAQTTLPGLYAVGEVACTGVHGANRLASTSLLEGLVWGARAAEHIVRSWQPTPVPRDLPPGPWSSSLQEAPPADILKAWKHAIRRTMWSRVGIVREAEGLKEALRFFASLRPKVEALYREYMPTDALAGLRNMVQVAILVAEAALANPVSCGCHYRADAEVCHVR